MHESDTSGKYLIQHHGNSILWMAGVRDIEAWTPRQAELVLARRLPDGFLEVRHHGRTKPDPYILEVATIPEARVARQIVDDALLVYFERRVLPEVVVLFLRPRGNVATPQTAQLRSRHGLTTWDVSWRIVKLWEVPAAELLAAGDVGLIPWVPLAKIDGPPEPVFRECRARIDRDAPRADRRDLLAVTQVLAHLNYNDPKLFQILGGRKAMIESPVLKELMAETRRDDIIEVLEERFGRVARDLRPSLNAVANDKQLKKLLSQSVKCPDLESFKKLLKP